MPTPEPDPDIALGKELAERLGMPVFCSGHGPKISAFVFDLGQDPSKVQKVIAGEAQLPLAPQTADNCGRWLHRQVNLFRHKHL